MTTPVEDTEMPEWDFQRIASARRFVAQWPDCNPCTDRILVRLADDRERLLDKLECAKHKIDAQAREIARLRKRALVQIDYSIALQRIIEGACHGTLVGDSTREFASHHTEMADDLRTRLEQAEQDSKRLDWMFESNAMWQPETRPDGSVSAYRIAVEAANGETLIQALAPTIREAIDAAMAAPIPDREGGA